MAKQGRERRADALSKQRIVEAAVAILDADGEAALTFRTLAARLATGSGAIFWHVANKDELLAATTAFIVEGVTAKAEFDAEPRVTIRAIALKMFDAIDVHPWVGAQLAQAPWQSAMLEIFERIGAQLLLLNVPEKARFDCASALVTYIIGAAGQNAANGSLLATRADRDAFLENVAAQWAQRDPAAYPFVHQIATQLREHDDREQFLAGIDLILAGIDAIGERS